MKMRFLLVPVTWLALALPAAAEKLSLAAVSKYLNDLQRAKGVITQINSDGSISTGTLMIRRPGRMRFEYDPPEQTLVVVGGGEVAIFDKKSNIGPDRYPLKRTPLSIILARNVDLTRARMVTGHSYDGTATIITAQDPDNPDYGNIQLKFTDNPIELRQWVVNSDDGSSTTVILGEMDRSASLPNGLFNIQALLNQ
ncbi:cell envelope biogenesis protein LolA [Pseudaestuariivita atlantica]|uniref:Cell envelope biogenesis protein LolA n=2 Tax=Pseudaestuariivita atlantica TaxID=1317121 RepID=A0A0L1JP58_9RHOB|nr:outer membrane lipoprotein carrier protein LolA [Pseudaestuariivita atlantica]KNG93492.1 cell envelope biogenesis protein LolA [Pseudaestuariivita atlantica]